MEVNKINDIDRNTKESALQILKHFQKKNKDFLKLVLKFDLEWHQPVLEESLTVDEINKHLKNIKTTIKI